MFDNIPVIVEFISGSRIQREKLGPSTTQRTTIEFRNGEKVALPSAQIVLAEDVHGSAHVGFNGMKFTGLQNGLLVFTRDHELQPSKAVYHEREHHGAHGPHGPMTREEVQASLELTFRRDPRAAGEPLPVERGSVRGLSPQSPVIDPAVPHSLWPEQGPLLGLYPEMVAAVLVNGKRVWSAFSKNMY